MDVSQAESMERNEHDLFTYIIRWSSWNTENDMGMY